MGILSLFVGHIGVKLTLNCHLNFFDQEKWTAVDMVYNVNSNDAGTQLTVVVVVGDTNKAMLPHKSYNLLHVVVYHKVALNCQLQGGEALRDLQQTNQVYGCFPSLYIPCCT